jgi:hypothetical protein
LVHCVNKNLATLEGNEKFSGTQRCVSGKYVDVEEEEEDAAAAAAAEPDETTSRFQADLISASAVRAR